MGFGRLTESLQEEVFAMFIRLCKDETPLVRKVAAQNLEHWTKLVKTAAMLSEIISMFKAFTQDDQDSIRIQVVPITIAVSTFVTSEVKQADILPAVLEVARDKSWRVRWSVAHRLHEIMKIGSLGGDQAFCDSLCDVFTSLLSDIEPEVRTLSSFPDSDPMLSLPFRSPFLFTDYCNTGQGSGCVAFGVCRTTPGEAYSPQHDHPHWAAPGHRRL
jgi:serine/threonine-protein phosphatase 2A regulatory subunit A